MRQTPSVSRFFLKYALLLIGLTVVIVAAVRVMEDARRAERDMQRIETDYLAARQLQLKQAVQDVLHIIRYRRNKALKQRNAMLRRLARQGAGIATTRNNPEKAWHSLQPPPFVTVILLSGERIVARTGGTFAIPPLPDSIRGKHPSGADPMVEPITFEGRRFAIASAPATPARTCVAICDEQARLAMLQEDILSEIAAMRFEPEGYVFVNTFDGIPLIRDGERIHNGTSMWELTDPNGVKVIQLEYEAARKPEGGVIFYSWRRLTSEEVAPKMSYIAGDPEWHWMIGTGVYLDDLKTVLQQRQGDIQAALRRQLGSMLGLYILMTILIIALSLRFRKKLDREFQVFTTFFHRAAEGGQPIDPERLAYREFRELAGQANTMLAARQQLLAQREQSEAKFRALFEQSSDAMSILGEHGFIDCNRALMKMFGAKRKEELLVHPVALSPEMQPDGSRSDERAEWMIRHAMETGHHRFEWRHRKLDGTEFWCEIMLTRIPWDGQDCLFVVWRDISNRKEAELALRRNEARLRKSQAMARVGHWELDVATGLYTGSEILYEIYGFDESLAPVAAERITDVVWPEDRDRVSRELRDLIVENQPFDTVFRIVRESDGEVRHLHSAAEAVRDETGRCRKLIGVVQDITDLKRLELVALSERERLRTVIDSIAEAVIVTEPDTRIVQLNPNAEALLGVSEAEAVDRLLLDVLKLETPDGPVPPTADDRPWFPGDARLIRPDGSRRQVLISSSTFELSEGSVAGLVLVIRDVTELKQMEDELQKAQRLESLGYLAGGIAHDFNNQLTGITGALSLARQDVSPGSHLYQLLDQAEKAAVQCRTLTGQLLTFARGGEPVIAPLDLKDLLVECISVATSGKGVQVQSHLPDSLPAVKGDRGQLHQVFTNILINAVQAAPESGGRITVGTETDGPNPRTVSVTIRDNGPGIPPDVMPRIFDPFFTTKADGTGLGLSTAFSIVRRHNGELTIDSEPGHGTTVRIVLPVSEESPPSSRESEGAPAEPKGLRVLVMDDEPIIRDLAQELFDFLGHHVTITADGKDAIAAYREGLKHRPFDLVFLDITVPGGMGGRETIAELTALDPDVRAIVMSGYAKDPLLADPESFGFSGRLAKPFKLEEVRQVIRNVMHQRASMQNRLQKEES